MRAKLRQQSGETLAEVLVAFAVLALFATLFLGAVRFADRMNLATETEEETVTGILQSLYEGEGQVTQHPAEEYTFLTPDGTPAFSIQPPRQTVTLTVEEGGQERQYSFRRFAGEAEP